MAHKYTYAVQVPVIITSLYNQSENEWSVSYITRFPDVIWLKMAE